jgi:hypothetical protein
MSEGVRLSEEPSNDRRRVAELARCAAVARSRTLRTLDGRHRDGSVRAETDGDKQYRDKAAQGHGGLSISSRRGR